MWKVFGCKTLEDYHNLYLELDTVLLADIFERYFSFSSFHFQVLSFFSFLRDIICLPSVCNLFLALKTSDSIICL